jgi:predicted nucleic acid-binding protein
VLRRPKFERLLSSDQVGLAVGQIADIAVMVDDHGPPFSNLTVDRDDDYLVDLALRTGAVLVTGDESLTRSIHGRIALAVMTAREIMDALPGVRVALGPPERQGLDYGPPESE